MEYPSRLLKLAFDWYVSSYLLTKRQRQLGRLMTLGDVLCVHYDYMLEGESRQADNFFVLGADPEIVAATIRAYGPATEHRIYVVGDRPGLPLAYMRLGCSTLTGTNSLMARGLEQLPEPGESIQIRQARTPGDIMDLNTIDGADLTLAEDVYDPSLVFYYALVDQRPVAMARVGRKKPGAGWVSHVYTAPDYRGRRLASALMSRVLAEQVVAGDRLSLLLATENAHAIYRRLGYLDVAPVLNFVIN